MDLYFNICDYILSYKGFQLDLQVQTSGPKIGYTAQPFHTLHPTSTSQSNVLEKWNGFPYSFTHNL
jgi:hypothetical protein